MISFLDIKPYNCFVREINSPTHRTPVMFGEYIRIPYVAPSGAMSNLKIYEWLMSEEVEDELDKYKYGSENLPIVVLEKQKFLWGKGFEENNNYIFNSDYISSIT